LHRHIIDGGQRPTRFFRDMLPDEAPFFVLRQREVLRVLEKEEASLG
jgi:hypothetical protein